MDYVIIGNSASGIACVEAIRSKDKKSGIAIVSEEDYHIYSRCLLSYYLAGDIAEEKLTYRPDDFYKANKVASMVGYKCEKVLPEKKVLKIDGKKDIKFDKLLIAAGARPKFPEIPGVDKKGVMGLRTIRDAKAIQALIKETKTVAILGGGLIGMKAAYGLSTHGKDVRVIVKSGQVLSQILDKKAAAIFQEWIGKKGITIMTGLEAKEISGKDKVRSVILDNGEEIECEMIVVGKGVQPNTDIVKDSGIKIDEGILVNEYLETNIESIYASGDIAQAKDVVTGESRINALWPIAVEEGRIAGLNIAGEKTAYEGSLAMNSVEFFGLPVISVGITRPKSGAGFEEIVYEDASRALYKKIVIKDQTPVGMIFVNDIKNAGIVGLLIRNKIDISGIKSSILEENFDFAKIADIVKDKAGKFKQEEFKDIIITY